MTDPAVTSEEKEIKIPFLTILFIGHHVAAISFYEDSNRRPVHSGRAKNGGSL